jgi:HAD superfamily hydrolase (TIGR01490 family)
MKNKRAAKLSSMQGASENREGSVHDGTLTATRSLQRRNGDKSMSSVASSAGKQTSAVRRPFAAFDIDGTLIRWQLYHALVNTLTKHGHLNESLYPTIHEARMIWKNRTHAEAYKAYELELVELYNKNLTSLKVSDFNKVVDDVFEEYKDQVYVYTRDLIKELKVKGYLLFAISGSQVEIVSKIADYYSFDEYSGAIYPSKSGVFTGEKMHHVGKKHEVINEFIKKYNPTLKGSVAVGDSAGDISMLEMVERPIAFNPEAALFKIAKEKDWKVVVERKNMFYELESKNGKYELAQTNAG